MNFLTAIKHAAIGYGIRRKLWDGWMILHLDNFGELRWVDGDPRNQGGLITKDGVAKLLDDEYGLDAESIRANDWEAI